MNKLLAALAMTAIAIPASAMAADLRAPVKVAAPVAVAPVTNWSGFYVGGHVGLLLADVERKTDSLGDHYLEPLSSVSHDDTSVIGGGQVGFNWQFGSWVFGVEGTGSATSYEERYVSPLPSTVGSDPVVFKDRIDDIFTVAGRLGFAWERSLFYVKGGYATVRIGTRVNDDADHPSFDSKRHDGFVVGGGWEYMIDPNWTVGLDYAFIRADRETHSQDPVGGVAPADPAFYSQHVSADLHQVTARLNYRFNLFGGM